MSDSHQVVDSGRAPEVRPLRDKRVLNLASGVAGRSAGSLLGGLGADVLAIPDCDRAAETELADVQLKWHMERGQRMFKRPADTGEFLETVRAAALAADLVIEDETIDDPLGVRRAVLDAAQGGQPSVVSVTPFGLSGPWASREASDITLLALSGLLASGGDPDRSPLQLPGHLTQSLAGLGCFTASAAALLALERGQGARHIDFAILDALTHFHENAVSRYSYGGAIHKREGNRLAHVAPWTMLPCRDGHIGIIVQPRRWDVLCLWMERPELIEDVRFADPVDRGKNVDDVEALLLDWISTRDREYLFRGGQARQMPFGAVRSAAENLQAEQLTARGFSSPVEGDSTSLAPGFPLLINGQRPKLESPQPAAEPEFRPGTTGRHVTVTGAKLLPLSGIRVIDMGIAWAGAFCGRLLGDLGAEVIKVETRKRLDLRGAAKPRPGSGYYLDGEPGSDPWNRSAVFHERHRNKKSLTLELDHPLGRATFLKLVAASHVITENYSPRVMEQFRLTYSDLMNVNPGIVLLSMSGMGRTGPDRDYVSFGDTLEELSGSSMLTGYQDGPPMNSGLHYPDPAVGTIGAGFLVSMLVRQIREGKGGSLDMSQLEAVSWMLGPARVGAQSSTRAGNRHPVLAPQGCYPCDGSDRWVALTVTSDDQWLRLATLIGRQDLGTEVPTAVLRQARHDELDAAISAWTSRRSDEVATRDLHAIGVPAAPVLEVDRLLDHEQLKARSLFDSYPAGSTRPLILGGMWSFDGIRTGLRSRAPDLGEHNYEVLTSVCGLGPADIAELEEAGVIGTQPLELEDQQPSASRN